MGQHDNPLLLAGVWPFTNFNGAKWLRVGRPNNAIHGLPASSDADDITQILPLSNGEVV